MFKIYNQSKIDLSLFQIMAFTSLGVVLISTLTFILGTFPEFQPMEESGVPSEYPQAVMIMEVIDNIAVAFFLMEYVVRKYTG